MSCWKRFGGIYVGLCVKNKSHFLLYNYKENKCPVLWNIVKFLINIFPTSKMRNVTGFYKHNFLIMFIYLFLKEIY